MVKKRKTCPDSKIVLIYVVMVIGILMFIGGWLYMLFFGVIDVVTRSYTISIPRKYHGELVLSPSGGVRLNLGTVTEIYNTSIKKGVIENATIFEVKNTSFYIVSIKIRGENIDNTPVSLVVSLKNLDSNNYVGSAYFANKSKYALGEMPLTSYLGEGRYVLELMSNEDMTIDYLAVRGLRYENITSPILSITFSPQEFNQQTLYYIEKVDIRNLWISMFMIISGTITLIAAFMMYTLYIIRCKLYSA